MKTAVKKIFAAIGLIFSVQVALGQCIGGGSAGTISPTATYQTVCIKAGQYLSFSALEGIEYV
ncbi:MAG TPA: hypothetical protein VIK89_08625, partial [Cytophagaceae bacterium]